MVRGEVIMCDETGLWVTPSLGVLLLAKMEGVMRIVS